MTPVRCSALDRVMACASSALPCDHPYSPESDEAREGTAAHAVLAQMVNGEEPDVDAAASEHRVDRDILAGLLSRGRLAWRELSPLFPEARAEVRMEEHLPPSGLHLTGTTDALSIDGAAVLDWKTGWLPSDHPHQLRGYAMLALARLPPDVEELLAFEVHLRAGTYEPHRWSVKEMLAWADKLSRQVARAGQQWGPGPVSCHYCPHQTTCQAREDYVRGACTSLAPLAGTGAVTREQVAGLWDQSRVLSRALARYEAVVGEMLAAGPLPLDDTRQLELVDETRDKITPSLAAPVLHRLGLGGQMDHYLRVSKGALCDAAKAGAAKGKGAAAVRGLLAELESAEAIEKTTQKHKRVTRRV